MKRRVPRLHLPTAIAVLAIVFLAHCTTAVAGAAMHDGTVVSVAADGTATPHRTVADTGQPGCQITVYKARASTPDSTYSDDVCWGGAYLTVALPPQPSPNVSIP